MLSFVKQWQRINHDNNFSRNSEKLYAFMFIVLYFCVLLCSCYFLFSLLFPQDSSRIYDIREWSDWLWNVPQRLFLSCENKYLEKKDHWLKINGKHWLQCDSFINTYNKGRITEKPCIMLANVRSLESYLFYLCRHVNSDELLWKFRVEIQQLGKKSKAASVKVLPIKPSPTRHKTVLASLSSYIDYLLTK